MNDPRIDAYIAAAPEFARSILEAVRKRMHASVPGLEETMKWSSPHFSYKGGLFAGMACFKRHCIFGFWHPLLRGGDTSLEGMGRFRLESVSDIPPLAQIPQPRARGEAPRGRRREGAAEAAREAQSRARAARPGRGLGKERESARGVRGVQPDAQARIHRVDPGGKAAAGDARKRLRGERGPAAHSSPKERRSTGSTRGSDWIPVHRRDCDARDDN